MRLEASLEARSQKEQLDTPSAKARWRIYMDVSWDIPIYIYTYYTFAYYRHIHIHIWQKAFYIMNIDRRGHRWNLSGHRIPFRCATGPLRHHAVQFEQPDLPGRIRPGHLRNTI